MDEFREKSGAGNLPVQNMPCWNAGMQPSKVELVTASAGPTGSGRSTDTRRSDGRQDMHDTIDRELGRALSDALTDILSAEKAPRQRRSVS